MKIMHIITGLNNGGAEAVLYRLVEADVRCNTHFIVSLMDKGFYGDRLKQCGVSVYTLNFSRGSISILGVINLIKILKKVKPDVVHTWMYHADLIGGIAARLVGIRSIVWSIHHANFDRQHNSRVTLSIIKICNWLSAYVPKKIISCSIKATKLHKTIGYSPEKFVQIPNGYNLNKFKPDADSRNVLRSKLGVAQDTFIVGMVARFDAQKNHRNLIYALQKLKCRGIDFICLLVGAEMDESNRELDSWIEEAGIAYQVKRLGLRTDIPAVMNALDLHVLSSLGEAFPNVLAEAMACGTPCVTTDVGDAALIVGENGWVVKSQNGDALADGIMDAYEGFSNHRAQWKLRQRACRSHITDNFELEKMCEKYRQTWKSCAN